MDGNNGEADHTYLFVLSAKRCRDVVRSRYFQSTDHRDASNVNGKRFEPDTQTAHSHLCLALKILQYLRLCVAQNSSWTPRSTSQIPRTG